MRYIWQSGMNREDMKYKNMDHIYAVIMAGGGGTRLWPISRRSHPKHVLPLIGNRTLFQSTNDRLNQFIPPENILVVTTSDQLDLLKDQVPGLLKRNFLVEPAPRGTASVVGLAAVVLKQRDPESLMMVLPSDHYIQNVKMFQKLMSNGIKVAETGSLVTIGITPTFPSTGYGYIQGKVPLSGKFNFPVYKVLRFIEKPELKKAKSMLQSGEYFWNSGMFIWRSDRILEEITSYMPELKAHLQKITSAWDTPSQESVLKSEWLQINTQTIDYGIMEHAKNVAVLPAQGLGWNDVGSWDSLFEVLSPDERGNVIVNNNHLSFDSQTSLVYAPPNKLVVTIGTEDLIIIDSEDSLLICNRENAQDVKKVIEYFKSKDMDQFL